MTTLEFRTSIAAPRSKVWDILWDNELYKQWTAPFSEGSRVKTDWKEGSKVYFLGNDDDGMLAIIEKKNEPEFMSFRHIGMVNKGVEDTESEKVKPWAGAHENYTLTEQGNKTDLLIQIDITEEYRDYFEKTWPKALDKVRELAEKN